MLVKSWDVLLMSTFYHANWKSHHDIVDYSILVALEGKSVRSIFIQSVRHVPFSITFRSFCHSKAHGNNRHWNTTGLCIPAHFSLLLLIMLSDAEPSLVYYSKRHLTSLTRVTHSASWTMYHGTGPDRSSPHCRQDLMELLRNNSWSKCNQGHFHSQSVFVNGS